MLERRRFLLDWTANLGTVGLLAVSGILINSIIAKYYGAAALGIFNQVFAVYILGSQLATLGTQFSVLRYMAQFGDRPAERGAILCSALVVAAATATIVVALALVIFITVGASFYSEAVAAGVIIMLPGLWCFALNKVLLNALNGMQYNRLFAAFTAFRYILMSIGIVAATAAGCRDYQLSIILPVSESILMIALVIAWMRLLAGGKLVVERVWIRRHASFGVRSILGGVAVELNTRIDVLILGIFTSDAAVGIYSFAVFFVEGILQLPQISRRIVDPRLTTLVARSDAQELGAFMRKGRNLGVAFMIVVALISIALYPLFATLLADRQIAAESRSVFLILMIGACVFGAYATFSGVFSQAGLPAAQSRFNVMMLATNAALNFALVPKFGINGAAVATSISFVLGTAYFRAMVSKHIAVRF
jgi:O-antigen/teichoic acid export membrane protein